MMPIIVPMRSLGAPEGMRIFLEKFALYLSPQRFSGAQAENYVILYLHIIRTFENRRSVEDRIDGILRPVAFFDSLRQAPAFV